MGVSIFHAFETWCGGMSLLVSVGAVIRLVGSYFDNSEAYGSM